MSDQQRENPPGNMRSLERALDVIQVLETSSSSMRLSDVARTAGLHLATTQRILKVLVRYGYAAQDANGYSMGIRSLLNAHAFLVSSPLAMLAPPILQELSASSGRTASLSTRVDLSQVLLVRVEGKQPLRYQLPVGEKLPLHLGGARVLAAAMPEDELDRLLDGLDEIRLASGVVLEKALFVESLRTIAEQGYAYGVSQRVLGAASVAVPVRSAIGEVVGAIQVSGWEEDFSPDQVIWYVGELSRASAALTKRVPH